MTDKPDLPGWVYRRVALMFPCPLCGAITGAPCVTKTGKTVINSTGQGLHPVRIEAEDFVLCPNPIGGQRVHVEGWPRGYQFIFCKTREGVHHLVTPTSRRRYTTTHRLLFTRRQEASMPEPLTAAEVRAVGLSTLR